MRVYFGRDANSTHRIYIDLGSKIGASVIVLVGQRGRALKYWAERMADSMPPFALFCVGQQDNADQFEKINEITTRTPASPVVVVMDEGTSFNEIRRELPGVLAVIHFGERVTYYDENSQYQIA